MPSRETQLTYDHDLRGRSEQGKQRDFIGETSETYDSKPESICECDIGCSGGDKSLEHCECVQARNIVKGDVRYS